MTRDEIITFAKDLAQSLQDDDTLDVFMDDVFDDISRLPFMPMLKAKIKALTSGTAEYDFEDDMLAIKHIIMDDELLSRTQERMLDMYSATWQVDTGTPTQYTIDEVSARKYLLYPIPNFNSDPLIPTHGEPYGEDFPDNSLVIIYADDREADIPSIMAIPLAFDALAREFDYPSDHIDAAFVAGCIGISQLFYRILGVL